MEFYNFGGLLISLCDINSSLIRYAAASFM